MVNVAIKELIFNIKSHKSTQPKENINYIIYIELNEKIELMANKNEYKISKWHLRSNQKEYLRKKTMILLSLK